MNVEVCYALTSGATRVAVSVDDGATLRQAVGASGIVGALALDPATLSYAIFGKRAGPDAALHDGDRIEILRPLKVDPKEARHRRVAKRRAGRAAAAGSGG